MSVGVTKSGNLYEKSNAGKIVATTAGGIAGAICGLKIRTK
jgi:outer membrane lipoprotein SlyB